MPGGTPATVLCVFSLHRSCLPIRKLYPEEYQLLKHDEEILEFMLDNKCDLDTFVGNAKSCVYHGDESDSQSGHWRILGKRYLCKRTVDVSGRGISWGRRRAMLKE